MNKGRGVCPAKVMLETRGRGRFKESHSKIKFSENADFKAMSPEFQAIATGKFSYVQPWSRIFNPFISIPAAVMLLLKLLLLSRWARKSPAIPHRKYNFQPASTKTKPGWYAWTQIARNTHFFARSAKRTIARLFIITGVNFLRWASRSTWRKW